ncbi:tRNA1(Val) (adenine(37)-N6)-methyltransferase [Terrarubrum flagellatum]|uniref:tRNA1(Val) (adenine(37)-N6)-methyltransferase n=1 Tax=Terrirubrum flagellatum TaxID=2895980 RepID=UPI003144D3EA
MTHADNAEGKSAAEPDALFGGKLLLRQAPGGHRVGTDAVLLAAATPDIEAGLIVDLGCGVGAVGLAVALAAPATRVHLVDSDADALALAEENIALNGLSERVSALRADILGPQRARHAAGLGAGSAELVLTNPPYGSPEKSRSSPDARRAAAHVMPAGGLGAWIASAFDLLKPRGELLMIHRADALADALATFGERWGGLAVRPIHPRPDKPATRILLRAIKGARTPLSIAPPLILHRNDGHFTHEAEAIHRGEARIPF